MWIAGLALPGVLTLGGCASASGAASPAPTETTVSASPSPTSSGPETTPGSTPQPTSTETSVVEAPFNGEVLIVTADVIESRLEVTAMVPGVSESGGTCTLELVGEEGSATIAGTAGNGVTYCGLMSLRPESAAEPWQFRVLYESPSTRAESALSTVERAR